MAKPPPVHELEFLKLSANHGELTRKMATLGCPSPDVNEFAKHICEAWFRLGEDHLAEARLLFAAGCKRATYSRAYYAAYNASKSTRYMVQGAVSLKGDDHGKASTELPNDFPNLVAWAGTVSSLYQHRLRADYDNWSTTASDLVISPADAIKHASDFVSAARSYLNSKFGMSL